MAYPNSRPVLGAPIIYTDASGNQLLAFIAGIAEDGAGTISLLSITATSVPAVTSITSAGANGYSTQVTTPAGLALQFVKGVVWAAASPAGVAPTNSSWDYPKGTSF